MFDSPVLDSDHVPESESNAPCDCHTPCHRVVYTPQLSQASLSPATVTKMWKGRLHKLNTARDRYKTAKELVQRVDPDIIKQDRELYERMASILHGIASTAGDMVVRLIGDSTPIQQGERMRMWDGSLEYVLMETAVEIGERYRDKLDHLRQVRNQSITSDIKAIFNLTMTFLHVTAIHPRVVSNAIDGALTNCSQLEAKHVTCTLRNASIPRVTDDLVGNITELHFNVTQWTQRFRNETLKDYARIFKGGSEQFHTFMAAFDNSSCLADLMELQIQYEAALAEFLTAMDEYSYNKSYINKLHVSRRMIQVFGDNFIRFSAPACDLHYPNCPQPHDDLNDGTASFSMSGEFRQIIQIMSDTTSRIVGPIYMYTNSTSMTKSELYELIHSDDYDYNNFRVHGELSTLRDDHFLLKYAKFDQFEAGFLPSMHHNLNCSLPVITSKFMATLPLREHIEMYYANHSAITKLLDTIEAEFYRNSSKMEELIELLIDQYKEDINATAKLLLSLKMDLTNVQSEIKRSTEEFRDLDSLIKDV